MLVYIIIGIIFLSATLLSNARTSVEIKLARVKFNMDAEEENKNDEENLQKIQEQMEFYFSDPNLRHDAFLRSEIETNDGGCTYSIFQVSECGEKVRRRNPLPPVTSTDAQTIYVDDVPSNATHDRLKDVFSLYGIVDYVSLPRYPSGRLKGFAFVEFNTDTAAARALDEFGKKSTEACSQIVEQTVKSADADAKPSKKRKRKAGSRDNEVSAAKKGKMEEHQISWAKGMKIMPKKQWSHLKLLYKKVQREKVKTLKEKVRESRATSVAAKKGSQDVVPSSVVQFEGSLEGSTVALLKAQFSRLASVAYLDYEEGNSKGYVRFYDAEAAKSVVDAVAEKTGSVPGRIKSLKLDILQGDEEAAYVVKVEEMKKEKRLQARSQRRGYDKWMAKADAMAESKVAATHLVFPDTDSEEGEDGGSLDKTKKSEGVEESKSNNEVNKVADKKKRKRKKKKKKSKTAKI
eukprot:m.178758 g.178758  ORF g.178758 m.178758 type:complete len:462 (+) comp39190_c0_seq12:288-1673(+)